ncbi:MAG: tetratricopeptide repeat protein, partial [Ignavibacteria bacterium]|nr:tetratricopeptide repeat protein [Ignavibacteria bacterium]
RQNNVEEAVNYFKEAISYKQTNKYIDNTIYSLARTYEELGDYTNAVTYYDELLSYYRESKLASQAQIRIGICYFKLKEYDSSILELSNPIVKQLPVEKQTEALYLLANSHYRVGEYANAEKVYREVIAKYPASSFIRQVKYAYAWSFFQQKKYADAYKLFNVISVEDDSIGVKSFYWKGESKRYGGSEREALSIYENFLQKYSGSYLAASALYQIGVINFTNGEYEKAGAALTKGVSTKNLEVRGKILTMLGEIELQKKKYQAALQYFNKVNENDIGEELLVFRGLLGKGTSLFYLNKYDDAIGVFSDIDFRAPSFEPAKVSFYLAECYFSKKDYVEALSYYNKISTEDESLQAL